MKLNPSVIFNTAIGMALGSAITVLIVTPVVAKLRTTAANSGS